MVPTPSSPARERMESAPRPARSTTAKAASEMVRWSRERGRGICYSERSVPLVVLRVRRTPTFGDVPWHSRSVQDHSRPSREVLLIGLIISIALVSYDIAIPKGRSSSKNWHFVLTHPTILLHIVISVGHSHHCGISCCEVHSESSPILDRRVPCWACVCRVAFVSGENYVTTLSNESLSCHGARLVRSRPCLRSGLVLRPQGRDSRQGLGGKWSRDEPKCQVTRSRNTRLLDKRQRTGNEYQVRGQHLKSGKAFGRPSGPEGYPHMTKESAG